MKKHVLRVAQIERPAGGSCRRSGSEYLSHKMEVRRLEFRYSRGLDEPPGGRATIVVCLPDMRRRRFVGKKRSMLAFLLDDWKNKHKIIRNYILTYYLSRVGVLYGFQRQYSRQNRQLLSGVLRPATIETGRVVKVMRTPMAQGKGERRS
jgi:hypothetical protein